jgi:hypothetical protein
MMACGSFGVRARARLVIPAVICLLWLLPNAASAQCWYDAGVYADLYDNGVDAIEVYGAGWDGSYCPPCPHSYQIAATLWFNSAVVDSESYDSWEGTASYGTIQSGWASYEVIFIINCACAGPIGVGPVGGSQQVQRPQQPTCTSPNLLSRSGVIRYNTYTYWISPVFTSDEEQGIDNAFSLWEAKNQAVGTFTHFMRSTTTPADIMISKASFQGAPGNAGTTVNPASGPMASAGIVYDSDTTKNPANPGELYVRKIFLHEVGHIHALDDTPGVASQSTVMLTNVPIGDLPADVTQCDADAGLQKSTN